MAGDQVSRPLAELIEVIRASGTHGWESSAHVLIALREIDRRLTALEERTAPPLSGNEVTTNLLAAAEESRAKAVEDGLAMLEGRTAITCTCRRMYSWDGTFHGISPEPDGCPMHGNRPEDVAARERWAAEHRARVGVEQVQNCPHSAQDWRIEGGEMWCDECDRAKFTPQMGTPFGDYPSLQAYLAANKALVGAVDKHVAGADSEPVTAGQRAAALVMLGPELREEERKQRAAMQEAIDAGRVDVISSSFSAAHVGHGTPPTELARALSEAVDGLKRTVRIAEETGEGRIAGLVRPALSVVSRLADEAARGGSST